MIFLGLYDAFKDKKNLLLSLAESREQILALEARVQSLESALEKSETKRTKNSSESHHTPTHTKPKTNQPRESEKGDGAPPLPPKTITKKKSMKGSSDQINR